jgi:uncharacterized repeat protein (TIGR02543 family)
MRKLFFLCLALVIGSTAFAQTKIQLRSVDKAECVKSDMTSLKASFSFSNIEAENMETKGGQFSWLSLPNTVIGGNEGEPQIPVVNELIAVPFGANPTIRVTSYSTTDYNLNELGIEKLVPRQPSLRKDQKPEDMPFVYNKAAYQTRGFRSEPMTSVYVDGIMRGVQVGKMTIEPVSYDPVNNTLRVFNDIEVEVSFDNADAKTTEDMLVKTYSPYFDIVYKQLFNSRAISDVYTQHPDLYTTPVKMIVITTSSYASNTTFQNWVKWKKQKGIYTTVYTTSETGTTSSSIKTFIRNKYTTDTPTFVVVVGDTGNITYSLSSSTTSKVTDLYYSSTTDSDLYPEMFYSRMPVSSTTELTNLLNKIMTYEKYTMSNPSYLDETLLIAGWDSYWTNYVGKPTIQYANNYYFNSSNGITPHVYLTSSSYQSGCYTYINQVGFANYTAHGDNTMWADPQFTVSNVSSLTNNDKYFWAMGNCCLAANWGYSGTCFAEALLRAANKGAFGYIGSCPETYWYEDYYFGVGATTRFSQMPTQAQTKTGCYDAMFDDTGFNTLNSVPFIGNLAVAYAYSGSYTTSISEKYYWEAYHCLGDGSVMPYHKNPSANTVNHANQLYLNETSFTVSADAGSYVAITVNDEIIGVAQVPSNGTIEVPIIAQTTPGTAHIVVTRNQRQPYINDIAIVGGTLYTINATASPAAGGTIEGAGSYYEDSECTLTANANEGYTFTKWTKNGTQVSTQPSYTFTVSENADYVAVFTINSYQVSATANPTVGGTITGAGSYNHGTTANLTATAAQGYTFVNWTKDGNEVSTNASLSFIVTQPASLVANFSLNKYVVTATSLPSEGGTVTIGGNFNETEYYYDFENGTTQGWTILQGPNSDSPDNWMHCANYTTDNLSTGFGHNSSNGFMLSESLIGNGTAVHPDNYLVSPRVLLGGSINFWVTNLDNDFGAEHFGVAVSTTGNTDVNDFTTIQEWTLSAKGTGGTRTVDDGVWYEYTVDLSAFSGLGYVAIRHFDCTDQWLLCLDDITLTEGINFNHGASCTVTASPNEGYNFVNWTKNGNEVSQNTSFTFNVTEPITLVANFEAANTVEQNVAFNTGWNWWSTYLNINLSKLETILTNHATNITSQDNGSANYNSNYNAWFGSFTLDPTKMYKINATEACDLSLSAQVVDPAELEVTIKAGISWIGFPLTQAMYVDDALAGLTPEENDVIKTSGKMAMYSDGYWEGTLSTLEPGKGYVYNSRASQAKTFFYPSSKGETAKQEIGEPLFWNTKAGRYADNMNVVAVIEIDGQEALSDNIEIGAFVGNECRGSVRLSRSASTGRYLAFLTIQGTDDETVSFRVLDGDSQRPAKEVIKLRVDNVVGNVKSPFTLHVGSDELSLFPNPANRDERVHIALPASARLSGATVEVYNALGALVSSISASGTNVDLDAIHASGVYTVKVTDNKGNVSFGKLVVR